MNEKKLTDLYGNMQAEMKVKLQISRGAFPHSPTKGESTEADWMGWMKNYLPKRYSVDKSFVIDSDNHVSEQIDLVIYDQQYSHPVFMMNNEKYITAESVYAVFEIKQTLNKTYMEYAGGKIKSVRELKRTTTSIVSANGQASPKPLHRIVSGILTLDSDWVDPIKKNVVTHMLARPAVEQIDLVCSIEHGAFSAMYDGNTIKDVIFSSPENSLVFFFLELLKKLQSIGTVPAIDIMEYEKVIEQSSSNNV